MAKHIDLGKQGEDLAYDYLISHGFEILERNWRGERHVEIDLITLHKDVLVAIEVKTKRSVFSGNPFEAISNKKLEKLFDGIQQYQETHEVFSHLETRLDVVSIHWPIAGAPKIEYLPNIMID